MMNTWRNHFKTVALLAAFTALFMVAGKALAGSAGMLIGLALAGAMNLSAYWWSDKLILRMYRARPLRRSQAPKLYDSVERLARQTQIPMPRLYLIPEPAPNAFTTGRNPEHAAVAVTGGILEALDPQELEGVLAHELSHIKNRDTLISTIAGTFAGALSMLADMAMWGSLLGKGSNDDSGSDSPLSGFVGILLAPFIGMLLQAAISRSREFLADESGARATGDPLALAGALRKIEAVAKKTTLSGASPATAHLFVINPLRGRDLMTLFSTHPPTAERVKRLEAMVGRLAA